MLLNNAKKNYTSTEGEELAMVYALNKFRHNLLGNKFVFYVDHMALLYLIKKTSIVMTNCKVAIVISGIRVLGGVQTKTFPFCGKHSLVIT
jgi:hypothetical protein